VISTRRKMTVVTGTAVPGGLCLRMAASPPSWIGQWAGLLGALSAILLIISAIFAVIVLVEFFRSPKSWLKNWKVQLPIARVRPPGPAREQKNTSAAPPKFYSTAERERLADLYSHLMKILLAHGGNGGGDGAFMALARLGNTWAQKRDSWTISGIDEGEIEALLKDANDKTGALWTEFYSANGLQHRAEYLASTAEIAEVLGDGTGVALAKMQDKLNSFRRSIEAAMRAQTTGDKRLLEMNMGLTASSHSDYVQEIGRFQQWLSDANNRAVTARKELG